MTESSPDRLTAEALPRARAKLVLEIEGCDFGELAPEVREAYQDMLHDLAEVLSEGTVYGLESLNALRDGISNTQLALNDRRLEVGQQQADGQ